VNRYAVYQSSHRGILLDSMTVLERLKTTTPPRVLYHYTTQAKLLGILKSNCMWATAAQYLNDASEYEYGFA